jgi:HSP20 family protein
MNHIIRWSPIRELEEMSERLDRLFGRSLPSRLSEAGREALITAPEWTPSVDIVETPEEFIVKAELPEVKKEDVKVNLSEGILRIEGERKQEKEEKGKKFHRIERFYGNFIRSFSVPDNIDDQKIRAEFKDGVLNIHLPKTEKAKPKATEITVS